jgi:Ala-tRNA(Pro) deacylase
MAVKKLREFLDRRNVKYVSLRHSPAYTAQEIAAAVHVPGKTLAKTVVLKVDGKMIMAVLPASHQVNYEFLKKAWGSKDVRLASEQEIKCLFPDCEIGAMPPFGNLYGMNVVVSPSLAEDREIAFNAGSHCELIRLAYRDYERLVSPKISSFSVKIRS